MCHADRPRRTPKPKQEDDFGQLSKQEKEKLRYDRYRAKLKSDHKNYELYKARDAERKKKYRATLSEAQKVDVREKARLRNQAYR